MAKPAKVIEQIRTYISRCNSEKHYQGTHDEQISLRKIQNDYQKLSSLEQIDVQNNYHILYNQSFSPYQKNHLEKANATIMKIAAMGAMCGAVTGIVLGTGCFKTAVAGSICTFSGSFFANRSLENSDEELGLAKKKILPFERIKAIFECSPQPSSEIKLTLPDLNTIGLRRRTQRSG
jgi:hypothetical protein